MTEKLRSKSCKTSNSGGVPEVQGFSASQFEKWSLGGWQSGRPEQILGLANDTRTLQPGQLFAALTTAQRDGHDFLQAAAQAGATGAIVSDYRSDVPLPQLLVEDVGEALLRLARGFRDTWSFPVVGITGSCGKTTCKEVLACLLGSVPVLATEGNLNNLIGVPRSILKPMATRARSAVLEAGISLPGEMEKLAAAIDPEFAIITAIGASHLEGLGTVENVAREKGKLLSEGRLRAVFLGATCQGYARFFEAKEQVWVLPNDALDSLWNYRFSQTVSGSRLEIRLPEGVSKFEYKGTGVGLASNVALALACAIHLGKPVAELQSQLADWAPAAMRNEWLKQGERKVFLDCYNANPVSMSDSVATFVANTPENQARLFVIGCMEELGEHAARLHEELGRDLPVRNEDFLLVIGGEASSVLRGMKNAGRSTCNCSLLKSAEEAASIVSGFQGNVFLKGSRRYRLETALQSTVVEQGGVAC